MVARPRVAITGIGVVSPFGVGRDLFWSCVSRGQSGTRAVTDFDTSSFTSRVAAWVPEDAITAASELLSDHADENGNGNGNGRADPRRYAKVSRIAVLAAREALQDAGMNGESSEMGVIVGSGAGGIDVAERQYAEFFAGAYHRVSPVRDSGLDRGHRLERNLDRARPARHESRAVHRVHELDRRDWLCRGACSAWRGRCRPDRRRRRVRHAWHDAWLQPDARDVEPPQRSAGRSVAPVRSPARRLRPG